MPQLSLRFGICEGDLLCSATWKLWTETSGEKSEVYLACRALGGDLKASMHDSGNWHVSFAYKTFREKVEGIIPNLENRFTEKWPRPAEIAKGIALAFRIVTPSSCVSSPRNPGKEKKIIWIHNVSKERAIEIDIFFTKPFISISEWPGKNSMHTKLIGSIPLNNGDNICAVYRDIETPDFSNCGGMTGHLFKGKTKADLKSSDNLRALAFNSEPDGSRVIYDLAVEQSTS